jgi:hypothetical protein
VPRADAWEDQRGPTKLARGSVLGKEGRRRGLHGEAEPRRRPWRAATLWRAGASPIQLGSGKGVKKEVGNVRCTSSRGGEGRGRREMEKGRTARRRGGSAFNLDVRAVDGDAWRGREASGRNRGHSACPTSGRDAVPDVRRRRTASSRRDTGKEDGGDGIAVIRSKFKIRFANSIFLLLYGPK